MKRSDISDAQVIEACRARMAHSTPDAITYLMETTGAPEKVCYAAMTRAYVNGCIEYGVSLRMSWPIEYASRTPPRLPDRETQHGKRTIK